jgi:hypothetical protein
MYLAAKLAARKQTANDAKSLKGSKKRKQKNMSMKYWIEAADPQHRYGSLLEPYCRLWMKNNVQGSFFEWLDEGEGREIDLQESPRQELMASHVEYLDKSGREQCEIGFAKDEKGQVRLIYKESGERLDTPRLGCCCFWTYRFGAPSKYIFVVDGNNKFFVHRKKTGAFHHSSFLGGRPAIAAGGLVAKDGKLLVVNSNSGHYKPSAKMLEKTFKRFEDDFGLLRDSYTIVYPRTVKLCGCSCLPEIASNAPCFGGGKKRTAEVRNKLASVKPSMTSTFEIGS